MRATVTRRCSERARLWPQTVAPDCGPRLWPQTVAYELPDDPLAEDRLFVFPSPRSGGGIAGHAISSASRRCQSIFASKEPFTAHDLRRTAATGMAALGVPDSIISRCLNHITGLSSVTQIHYNHHAYLDEKRAAMERWERRVLELVGEAKSNVVPMPKRGVA